MEFLCFSGLVLACTDAQPQQLSKPQNRKKGTRHLHCKHLLSVSMASDVLLRDARLEINILCSIWSSGVT